MLQDKGILADTLLFMVRAGSWLTEFVSKEAGVSIDSSEHETDSPGVSGLAKVRDRGGGWGHGAGTVCDERAGLGVPPLR